MKSSVGIAIEELLHSLVSLPSSNEGNQNFGTRIAGSHWPLAPRTCLFSSLELAGQELTASVANYLSGLA